MCLGFGNWIFAVLKSRSTVEKCGLGWCKGVVHNLGFTSSQRCWAQAAHTRGSWAIIWQGEPPLDSTGNSDGYHWGSTYIFLLTPFFFSFFTLLTLFCLSLCVLCVWGGDSGRCVYMGLLRPEGSLVCHSSVSPFSVFPYTCLELTQ